MIDNFQNLRANNELKSCIDDIVNDVLFKCSKPKQGKEPIVEKTEKKNTSPGNRDWRDIVVKDIKMQMRLKGLVNKINPLIQSKIISEPKAVWINNEQGITNTLQKLFGGLFVHKAESNNNIKNDYNPDLMWNNKKTEIKEVTGSLRTIEARLKKATKQTDNSGIIIIDVSGNSLNNLEIINGIKYRIRYHLIESEVIVLRDNRVLAWFKVKK